MKYGGIARPWRGQAKGFGGTVEVELEAEPTEQSYCRSSVLLNARSSTAASEVTNSPKKLMGDHAA